MLAARSKEGRSSGPDLELGVTQGSRGAAGHAMDDLTVPGGKGAAPLGSEPAGKTGVREIGTVRKRDHDADTAGIAAIAAWAVGIASP